LQFRYSGPTTQATTYYSSVASAIYNETSTIKGITNGTHARISESCDNLGQSSAVIEFTQVRNTSLNPTVLTQFSNAYAGSFETGGGYANTQRAYTGFLLSMSSGNISVTASLYGYRN
jgi:hypothetical protein